MKHQIIIQAPWSFGICVIILGIFEWVVLSILKSQEISNLRSRLDLKEAEISDYKRKLEGATPDQAKERIDLLEAAVERIKPRKLSTVQKMALSKAMSSFSGHVAIMFDMSCPDASLFANDFEKSFQDAKWIVQKSAVLAPAYSPKSGLAIQVPDPNLLTKKEEALSNVLHEIDISFEIEKGQRGPSHLHWPDFQILITSKAD